MTKAERIMQLYDGVRTPREIAEMVDCHPAYVRVVARQRKGGGMSEKDRRYFKKFREIHGCSPRTWRCRHDPEAAEARRRRQREYLRKKAAAI